MNNTDEPATSNPTDDDAISLTSTQYGPENADQEYFVEDILAEERDNTDGNAIYLVQWTGYPLENCTWEPKENIDDDMLEHLWESKRRKPDYQPFDYRLLADAVTRKTERHFRRNRARQRRNLPLTEPIDPLDAWMGPPIPITFEDSSPEAPSAADRRSESSDVQMTDPGAAIYIADDGKETLNPSDDDVLVLDALSTSPKPKKKQKKKKPKDVATPISAGMVDEKKSIKAPKSLEASATRADGAPKPATDKNITKSASVAVNNKPSIQRRASAQLSDNLAVSKASQPTLGRDKKAFSARKSGLNYGAQSKVANVFSGGKGRTRITKSEPSNHKKRPDFYFTNLRMRHQAKMRGRQKEDQEIDPKQLKVLFPIASSQPNAPVKGEAGRRASAASQGEAQAPSGSTPPPPSPPPPGVLERDDQAAPKRTKKKSVRYSAAEESERPCGETFSAGNATVLDDGAIFYEPEQLPQATQSVAKTLALGEQGRPVETKFTGVPSSDGRSSVLQSFLDERLMLFGYTCLAATFLIRFGEIRQSVLFSGGIEGVAPAPGAENENAQNSQNSQNNQAMLDTAAERLRATTSCLVFAKPTYFIVLYPARSDNWKDAPFGSPLPEDASNCVLRYLTFDTPSDFTPLLQPLHDAAMPWEKGTSHKINDRARLMQAFFELDWGLYRTLLPRKGRQTHAKRNFFLAFPPSAPHAMQQMAFWLRSVDPKCALFLCVNPGAWMAFQERVVAESEVGVVLVHEVATWTIRRFPGLTDLLLADATDCRFWCVSQSILVPPLFPSPRLQLNTHARFNDTMHRPGRFRVTQLFPRGLAALLTPSFIVTEPQRTFALLQWFHSQRLSDAGGVALVTAGHFCEYLRDVAEEKARQRDELLANRDLRSPSERDNAALRMGIDAASCEDHFKAWLLATEIFALPQKKDWCVIEALDIIDSNDEQSLVNWFGLFCMEHMDRFRSFYVVGSKGAIKTKESGRGRVRIRLPRFAPGTTAYPNDIRVPDASDADRGPQPAASTDNKIAPPRLYPSVYTTEFSSHLRQFCRTEPYMKSYGYPVLWKDDDEAFRHGCMASTNTTIAKWFAFTWPFNKGHRAYIGLFYPIDEDMRSSLSWDKRPRHPWLVVYRPVNPHKQPFSETELIFWDPRAESRYRGRPYVREADLTKAQRDVVAYIEANGAKKNEGLPLTTLYIGGNCEGASGPTDEFDATMQQLDNLGHNFKNVLPPKVTERGYRRVYKEGQMLPETKKKDSPRIRDSGAGDSRGTSAEPDSGAPVKIVFHPPRGDAEAIAAAKRNRALCTNELFLCTHRVLKERPRATSFMYEFRPTMEWYSKQVDEGRGHSHILVNSWEAFFNAFRIEASADVADPGSPMDEDSD